MQPSYIYCKVCGYTLNTSDFPKTIINKLEKSVGRKFYGFPTDDTDFFDSLLSYARETVRCPCCGNKSWIRKRWDKV